MMKNKSSCEILGSLSEMMKEDKLTSYIIIELPGNFSFRAISFKKISFVKKESYTR
jgi:hypothetical protein